VSANVIDASISSALVIGNADGDVTTTLATAPVIGQERHLIGTAVTPTPAERHYHAGGDGGAARHPLAEPVTNL
jgi:hypothetical protein